ncbi:MAG: M1 family metallopeptidase, partial [Gemmatimonadota bacterium]
MRHHLIIKSLLVLAALAGPVAAQSNTERMANDRYTRSHDYDLLHQRIELSDFDWDSTSFRGRVSTTLVALRPAFDAVILDAGHRLAIESVTGPRGVAYRYEHRGDTLRVLLPRPVAFRDTVRFTIAYRGKVENGQGLRFITTDGRPHRPQQIWSQGEDTDNHHWFPTYDAPDDKMTWEVAATMPAQYTLVSAGRLVADTRKPGGLRTMVWRQDLPASTYLVSIVIAPLVKVSDRWRTLPVDYWVYREDSTRARRLFGLTPDMMEVFTRLTGVKYPWNKYAQVTVADHFGGMEHVSATTLIDDVPDDTAYVDRPWFWHILIAHELAHQWFGNYVTLADFANMWLNEGFAEFMPGQYWGRKLGRHAEDDYYLDEYRQYRALDDQRRMPLAALGSNNVYPKGALVLRMLQKHLGEERFWAAVNRFLTTHAFGNATTDDFRQAVLDATGQNLWWFWDQWVYQAGHPEFAVTAAYDSAAQALTLTVKQTQQDTLKADSTGLRYTVPEVFRMPVTVRVGTGQGDVVHQDSLYAREQVITIGGVRSAPTMVIFDDGNRILKSLRFDQPTPWLATALERDPDLWNRWWIIGQLAERRDDSLAVRALSKAATAADYFLTRLQAVDALAGFTPEQAMPALSAALADTSAHVRAAAARSLLRMRTPEAAALARERF